MKSGLCCFVDDGGLCFVLQVPKGWDKLLVSVIYVETGKTVAKSGKAVVRNGACQWSETLSESVWVSLEESSVEVEDCLFKLVLSMVLN